MKNNTIKHWLDQVTADFQAHDLFYGHGTDNAWDEAVQLVLHVAELPINSGEEVLQHELTPTQVEKLSALTKKRCEDRIPLPYLTHQAWFMGLPFYVDERVLIPRSPFAEWIERQFTPWVVPNDINRILEIGTGSGCMSIAAALMFPEVKIDAVDISKDALAVAQVNVTQHQLQDRIRLIESDVYTKLDAERYDIIMANPPYVGAEEMATLPAEYRHEPESALEAPEEGLAIVDRILQGASAHLNPGGILVLEVGNSADLLVARYPDAPFVWLEQEYGGHGICLLEQKDAIGL